MTHALVARNPTQLSLASDTMRGYLRERLQRLDAEMDEARANLAEAQRRHYKSAPFRRIVAKLEKRRVFFEKIGAAIDAGYLIIPHLPGIENFIVRTSKVWPDGVNVSRWKPDFPQPGQSLPAGHGENRNAQAIVEHRGDDGDGTPVWEAMDWEAEIGFPLDVATPVTMEAVSRAAGLKIFDEIGVVRDYAKDPIIVGLVKHPTRRHAAFFLAWHFDPTVWG